MSNNEEKEIFDKNQILGIHLIIDKIGNFHQQRIRHAQGPSLWDDKFAYFQFFPAHSGQSYSCQILVFFLGTPDQLSLQIGVQPSDRCATFRPVKDIMMLFCQHDQEQQQEQSLVMHQVTIISSTLTGGGVPHHLGMGHTSGYIYLYVYIQCF